MEGGAARRRRSENAGHVRPCEIVADIEQAAGVLLRQRIGEAIAEIEPDGVAALAPAQMRGRDAASHRRRDRSDLESEPVDQPLHFRSNVTTRGDDERLGDGNSGHDEVVLGLQHGNAGISGGLAEHDGHQRGGIDGDHPGSPSSP